jgi:tRNA(fMet)-specific endonuclease VapC
VTHLDTSFLVDLLREGARGEAGPAHAPLDGLEDDELVVGVHVACELHAGAEISDHPVRERKRVAELLGVLQVVHPSEGFAPLYGSLVAELRRRGEPVTTTDLLIATSALTDGSPLITRTAQDSDRIPGLRVIGY